MVVLIHHGIIANANTAVTNAGQPAAMFDDGTTRRRLLSTEDVGCRQPKSKFPIFEPVVSPIRSSRRFSMWYSTNACQIFEGIESSNPGEFDFGMVEDGTYP